MPIDGALFEQLCVVVHLARQQRATKENCGSLVSQRQTIPLRPPLRKDTAASAEATRARACATGSVKEKRAAWRAFRFSWSCTRKTGVRCDRCGERSMLRRAASCSNLGMKCRALAALPARIPGSAPGRTRRSHSSHGSTTGSLRSASRSRPLHCCPRRLPVRPRESCSRDCPRPDRRHRHRSCTNPRPGPWRLHAA